MDWTAIVQAFGLVLVIEGVLPFVSPRRFREIYIEALKLDDRLLRGLALFSMLCGLLLVMWVH